MNNPSEAASILDQSTPPPLQDKGLDQITTAPPVQPQGKDERVSSRLESLIRREQQALARESAAKEKEKGLAAKLARIEEFESAKGGNSKKALELLGLSYDQLTESYLKEGEIPPSKMIQELQGQIEELKSQLSQDKDQAEQMRKREAEEQEQRALSGFKSQISQFLSDNKQRYELISFDGQESLIFDVIDEHYKRTMDPETGVGKVMKISEAADKVEHWLEQKYAKANTVSKLQTLWKSVPIKTLDNQAEKQTQQTKQAAPKTLTNQLSASPQKRTQPVTDEERVRRAIAYAESLRPRVG
jgi:hypothetical protein